ncbi:hypothetical protein RyT2_01430 [Pseudolactococcus yaeyamensis]
MKNSTLRKALVGLVLGSALLAVPVLADTNTNGTWGTGEDGATTVDYTVGAAYTVVIPSSLSVGTAGTYTGVANNVFINSNSVIAPTGKITVSLPVQNFEAKDATNASTIPFTVRYTSQTGATTGVATVITNVTGSPVTLLEQTGAQIAAVTPEDAINAMIGTAAISAQVEATVTPAQLATADVSGTHTGVITFAVTQN